MTVFVVNSGVTYADQPSAVAAEAGIGYGSPTVYQQSGESIGDWSITEGQAPDSYIYEAAAGEETTGVTTVGAQCSGNIVTAVTGAIIRNLRTQRIDFFFSNNHQNLNLVSDGQGSGNCYFFPNSNAGISDNCIRYNCGDGVRSGATNDNYTEPNCTTLDTTGFGVLRPRAVDSVSLNTGNLAYIQIGASSSNYWADDGTGSNAITENPVTDIFLNYPADLRIDPNSSVGQANAGAFIDSGGGGFNAAWAINSNTVIQ